MDNSLLFKVDRKDKINNIDIDRLYTDFEYFIEEYTNMWSDKINKSVRISNLILDALRCWMYK